ncbi:hypothetical protein I3843_07G072000 [Carya illinoinensis]|nr:hypothetical protein I3843_07G072000 [Carya illinoinensis]
MHLTFASCACSISLLCRANLLLNSVLRLTFSLEEPSSNCACAISFCFAVRIFSLIPCSVLPAAPAPLAVRISGPIMRKEKAPSSTTDGLLPSGRTVASRGFPWSRFFCPLQQQWLHTGNFWRFSQSPAQSSVCLLQTKFAYIFNMAKPRKPMKTTPIGICNPRASVPNSAHKRRITHSTIHNGSENAVVPGP